MKLFAPFAEQEPVTYASRFMSYLWLFLYALLLEMVTTVLFYLSVPREGVIGHFVVTLSIVGTSLLFVLLTALPSKRWMRRIAATLAMLLTSSLFLIEHYLLYIYGTPYTDSIALTMLDTNPGEVSGFINSPISFISIIKSLVTLLGVGGITYLIHRFALSRIRFKTPSWIMDLFVLFFLGGFLVSRAEIYSSYKSKIPNYIIMSPVDRFLYGTRYSYKENKIAVEQIKYTDAVLDYPITPRQLHGVHNVVIIIGESLRRGDMHCYGYSLPNTPKLDSLIASKQLLLFHDVVAPKPNTAACLSEVLTYHDNTTPNNDTEWYCCPTFATPLKKAGYYTYWVSNQEKSGAFVQTVPAIAHTCDSVCFINNAVERSKGDNFQPKFDIEVLPHLLVADKSRHRAIVQVVHLMGSHTAFSDRYPHDKFSLFKPKDIPEELTPRQLELTADYMNSIYYNDYVVSEIIKKYSRESAIILYFSDHGLARYDSPDNPDSFAHSASIPGLLIPFMVYMSPRFEKENPSLAHTIRNTPDEALMLDLFPFLLEGITGVHTPFYKSEYDFFSTHYNASRERKVRALEQEIVIPPKATYPKRRAKPILPFDFH